MLEETETWLEGPLDKKPQLFGFRVFTSEPTGKNLGTWVLHLSLPKDSKGLSPLHLFLMITAEYHMANKDLNILPDEGLFMLS